MDARRPPEAAEATAAADPRDAELATLRERNAWLESARAARRGRKTRKKTYFLLLMASLSYAIIRIITVIGGLMKVEFADMIWQEELISDLEMHWLELIHV